MPWQQLNFQCPKSDTDIAEALLMQAGALSILLNDAGDQPLFEPLPGESPLWDNVIISGIFAIPTDDLNNPTDFEELAQKIASHLTASRVWVDLLADKDWEREWMSQFEPIHCCEGLWIVPEWLTPPDPTAINIMMDPGLAFGTGYHATTRLCLDWLNQQSLQDKVVIDYGCGSGILGITALMMGAKHVYAVDIDPQAVLATQQNAKRNHVDGRISAFLPQQFVTFCENNTRFKGDLITANILAKPLIELSGYFAKLLSDKGQVVLSGLLYEQVEQIQTAYAPYFYLDDAYRFDNEEDKHWARVSGQIIV